MHTADPEHRVPHLAFQPDQLSDVPILPMGEVATSYYLRMRVQDKPGVLADITRILADRDISIDAMIQKEPPEGEEQTDIILLTHLTRGEERQRGDRRDRGAADGARQGRAHPPRRAATDALRLDPRRLGATRRSRSRRSCSKGSRPTAGWRCRRRYPQLRAGRARRAAAARLPRSRVRGPVALHRRHPGRRPAARSIDAHLHARRPSAATTSRR